jgi:Flp pilus assembly protein TadD
MGPPGRRPGKLPEGRGRRTCRSEVYYNLGRAFIEHAKPDLGVQYLRQSFTLEPNNADVHVVLGAAYLLRGRVQLYAEALKHLKRALQLDPHHRTAATNLALALVEIRNLDAAQKLLVQELKLFPTDAEAQYLAGLIILENAGNPNSCKPRKTSGSAPRSASMWALGTALM